MRCICAQSDLKEALIAASKALPKGKPQVPITAGIYFVTRRTYLEMHGTDFSTGVIAKIPAEIEIEGETVINGKNITEVIGKLSDSMVTISTEEDNNVATIKSDAATFTLYTMEGVEDFPQVNLPDAEFSFYIKTTTLKRLIARSAFAVSNDDSRPVFTGCSINVNGENIIFAATNTHRLVEIKSLIEDTIEGEHKIIVPAATLNNVLSILNSAKDEHGVKVEVSDRQISFTIGTLIVTGRLIDGNFPDYERVIPKNCQTFVNLEVKDLLAAINRVAVIAKQTEYNSVKLNFNNEGLEISAEAYGTGKVVEHLNAVIEGPNLEISFNLDYIQQYLRAANNNDILRVSLTDNLTPADFRLADEGDLIYVVTPVRA